MGHEQSFPMDEAAKGINLTMHSHSAEIKNIYTSALPYTFTTAKIQLLLPYVLFFHMAALSFFTYWKLSVLST